MKTVVGYIRVSTDKQEALGVSLQAQEKRIRDYCAIMDAELIDIMKDASSAKTIAGRPAMRRLLDLARSGAVNTVIACKLDRMFRNTVEAIITIRELDALGVGIVILNFGGQPLDTFSPQGKAFIGMMSVFAEFERNLIAERTRDALRHKRDSGEQYSRTPPYGWRYEEGMMLEDPDEQMALRHIYKAVRSGMKPTAIATSLKVHEFMTRSGKPLWQPGTIGKIINNAITQKKFIELDEGHTKLKAIS